MKKQYLIFMGLSLVCGTTQPSQPGTPQTDRLKRFVCGTEKKQDNSFGKAFNKHLEKQLKNLPEDRRNVLVQGTKIEDKPKSQSRTTKNRVAQNRR